LVWRRRRAGGPAGAGGGGGVGSRPGGAAAPPRRTRPAGSFGDLGSQRGHVDPLVHRRREVADAALVQLTQQLVVDRRAGRDAVCRYLRGGVASRPPRPPVPLPARPRPAGRGGPAPPARPPTRPPRRTPLISLSTRPARPV